MFRVVSVAVALLVDIAVLSMAAYLVLREATARYDRRSASVVPTTTRDVVGFQPGQPVSLPASHAATGRRTVVLAIKSDCPSCNAHARYLADLADAARSSADVSVVVITADPEAVIGRWLEENEISVDDIITDASAPAMGFRVTPTILVLGAGGTLTDVLDGSGGSDVRKRLIRRVMAPETVQPVVHLLDPKPLALDRLPDLVANGARLIDVRERPDCLRNQLAVDCIPAQELRVRATREFAGTESLVVDCTVLGRSVCLSVTRALSAWYSGDVYALVEP
jgi:hypothetical protein